MEKQLRGWCLSSVAFAGFVNLIPAISTISAAKSWPRTIGHSVGSTEKITYPDRPTVSARGDGVARAMPDSMSVSFGVEARCTGREECLATVSSMAQGVRTAEEAVVGPATKISTDQILVSPTFATPSPIQTPTPPAPEIGWKFEGRVRASADSIDLMAPLVSTALSAGASDVWLSGFVSFGPDQHGESGSRGNIFTGAQIFRPPPLPHETEIPFVILDVDADGASADECVRKGASLADHVGRVLADKLGSHGAAGMEEYQVRRTEAQLQHPAISQTPHVQVQQGFYAASSVVVKTRELVKLNAMVAAATAAGAVRAYIGYGLGEENQARKDAIASARHDAQGKAEAAASSVHMKLGKIDQILINTNDQPQRGYVINLANPGSLAQLEGEALRHTSLEAHANVTLTYVLK